MQINDLRIKKRFVQKSACTLINAWYGSGMENNYFTAAKKAAKAKIHDTFAAHAAAIETLRKLVPGKPEAFYGNMAWQAVLAAR